MPCEQICTPIPEKTFWLAQRVEIVPAYYMCFFHRKLNLGCLNSTYYQRNYRFLPLPSSIYRNNQKMSVYTQNKVPLGFYETHFDKITRQTVRAYYKKQQDFALKALLRAFELVELLNQYNSPTMQPFVYCPIKSLVWHCRIESARMYNEIVYLYNCAKAHFENAATAREYVANEYFGGYYDQGHETAIQMIDSEHANVVRYLSDLEYSSRWISDISCDKPIIIRYTFAESRFVTNSRTIIFPDYFIQNCASTSSDVKHDQCAFKTATNCIDMRVPTQKIS